MKRLIPVRYTLDGSIQCDVCPLRATVERPESRTREQAFYCDYDARKSLGRGDDRRPVKSVDSRTDSVRTAP